jgi:NADH dehydrogenase
MNTTSTSHATHNVFILGGSGFIGRELTRQLLAKGHAVSIVSRQPETCRSLKQAGANCLPFKPQAFTHLMEGHTVLINLIGILNEPVHNGVTFHKVHVELIKQALQAAEQAGIRRYLHMSALGADAQNGASFYQRSKGEAEDWAHSWGAEHGVAVTSFRPSVVFGPGDSFLNRFAQLARLMPGVFPLACPDARLSPVYLGDVVAAFIQALSNPASEGQRIDLCGPNDYSLKEIVELACRLSGHPRMVIGLPDWAARLQARALEYVPGQPFTRDNYDSLQVPNVCPAGCPRQPTRLDDIAPGYLKKK